MSGLRYAVDDRKADAVAHLAVARTQNTGPAFWVTTLPGMCDNPVILNLHLFKRDSYISVICQASDMQWTTEKQMRLPTWLRLGLKIQDRHFG